LKSIFAAITILFATQTVAMDLVNFNKHVDVSNVIVDENCAGVVLSSKEGIVLTAAHCVKAEAVDIEITLIKRQGYKDSVTINYLADVVSYMPDDDTALLKTHSEIMDKVETPIYSGPVPLRGSVVWLVGNPDRMYAMVTKGIFTSTNNMVKNTKLYMVDAQAVGGSSGGGAYTDEGELIGITSVGRTGASLAGIIPIAHIIEDIMAVCNECTPKEG